VLNAYIDWMPPDTELKVRMGLQPLALPNAAGGSSILDTDSCAAVALNYQFTENVGLSFFWARPVNDNYKYNDEIKSNKNHDSYLDNVDLFALSVPLNFDGIEVTPFIMYGLAGANAPHGDETAGLPSSGYEDSGRWSSFDPITGDPTFTRSKHNWHSAFWAGLPVKLTLWDPLNVEFEFNYGVAGSNGYGWMSRHCDNSLSKKYNTRSEGWLVKALVEYKMDWGTPGIFGWYASGDDDNPKNGSERMPAVEAKGNFTNFMGDGNLGWAASESWYDRGLNYAGTWGIGLQVTDVSFIEDLTHTFRVAYIGGTNHRGMAKYAGSSWAWATGVEDDGIAAGQPYLTTRDGLVEFDFVTSYQMYENFEVNFDFAYVINCIDRDTWKKADYGASSYSKRDAWRANLTFAYTF
ncbi:MAG: outer membrane homotrimeric porin, partial [Desulfovibrio sp.]|nr:outer membrane homotrimeric porin [Desulfovibrio sp.]